MLANEETPAGGNRRGASDVVRWATEQRKVSAEVHKNQIIRAVASALEDVDLEDREPLLSWIVGRGLIGLAAAAGFRSAASAAYGYADALSIVGAAE